MAKKEIDTTYKEEEKKASRRTNSKTVEFESIKEEKSVNYKKNLKVFITFSILSVLLFIYILYLVVVAFMP